ncbi:MAG: serine/threonine protein kinase [Myxococcales bacterium]|nr:serine/threonine protein kinase [Myxococcales bacterium]
MNCPSCNTPLEPNARFCGVCGYRLQVSRQASQAASGAAAARVATPPQGQPQRVATPVGGQPRAVAPGSAPKPLPAMGTAKPQQRSGAIVPKPKHKGDDIYIGAVLNNRFKVESKIGEGGFGAVYRGVQLATGRKVALKLLHPEMTKDENLVARFRREGMVLCNLRDAHTITTYDFDQTPDGTLYIAMELLEGKSLHQVFHEQAPLEWKRMFKILIEMCSSLAEAHSQGIVHRDLKPENVYLESRPGNPEFVKILDFGIAKVMRGDSIDPQSPQLTATGQTLGTLEYMSPEQLMGKQLDGRSDVYALGVVAYEMTTGRLPFPDAKGPAGLITAQLKQTPAPPSQANAKANLPPSADRVILKCLEKDKNNRFADVTAMANGLQEVLDQAREGLSNPMAQPLASSSQRLAPQDMLETRRGEMPNLAPPPVPQQAQYGGTGGGPLHAPGSGSQPAPLRIATPDGGTPMMKAAAQPYPQHSIGGPSPMAYPQAQPYMQQTQRTAEPSSSRWIWWVIGLLALGAAAGAVLAYLMR